MMAVPHQLQEVWVYLSTSPLLWLTLTLLAYQGAYWIYQRTGFHPVANPVLISVAILVLLLKLTDTPYQTYFDGAQFVHFLLGPATVALAIPLYAQLRRVKAMFLPLLLALVAGSATAILSAVTIGKLLGASTPSVLSLAPKSVTTPIAMGIAEQIGGIPSLTAVLVLVTGVTGAIGYPYLFKRLKIDDPAARGFAIGLTSHGVGTARAIQEDQQMGAFAALGMSLNGLLTSLLVPVLIPVMHSLIL